jgi:DNA-binding FrmR family transcriptional regulator
MKDNEHGHQHPSKKKVVNRMARVIGHMKSVKTMVEDDRDCTEILLQIVAVRQALTNCGKVLLSDHVQHCVKEAVVHQDYKSVDDLFKAVDKFIR